LQGALLAVAEIMGGLFGWSRTRSLQMEAPRFRDRSRFFADRALCRVARLRQQTRFGLATAIASLRTFEPKQLRRPILLPR
jgi:hypothetical protein